MFSLEGFEGEIANGREENMWKCKGKYIKLS